MNWIIMSRKSGKHFCLTNGNTEQLIIPFISSVNRELLYWRSNDLCSMWTGCSVSVLYSVVTGLVSSWGDRCIWCWWDLISSKQLFIVSVYCAQVFAEFSGHGNSIHAFSLALVFMNITENNTSHNKNHYANIKKKLQKYKLYLQCRRI